MNLSGTTRSQNLFVSNGIGSLLYRCFWESFVSVRLFVLKYDGLTAVCLDLDGFILFLPKRLSRVFPRRKHLSESVCVLL